MCEMEVRWKFGIVRRRPKPSKGSLLHCTRAMTATCIILRWIEGEMILLSRTWKPDGITHGESVCFDRYHSQSLGISSSGRHDVEIIQSEHFTQPGTLPSLS